MTEFALEPSGLYVPSPKLIVPKIIMPTKVGLEVLWDELESDVRKFWERILKLPEIKDRVLQMSGSLANYSSKALQDLLFGKTAYAGETTIYAGLWTAAIDDTFAGNTASEAAYTSYARLAMTNNTTIFAAGTGTTTYAKSFPSDAAKNFATSTGGSATVTYLGLLNGNVGTSADKGLAWCSVTSTAIASGDTPQLAVNAITVTQD